MTLKWPPRQQIYFSNKYLFINEKERNVSKHLFYFDFKAKIIRIQPAKKKLYLKSKSCQEILRAAILPIVLLELLQ